MKAKGIRRSLSVITLALCVVASCARHEAEPAPPAINEPIASPDPWLGAPIEAASEKAIVLQMGLDQEPQVPEWADVRPRFTRISRPLVAATYSERHTIAVGVPGAGAADQTAGSEEKEDCIELSTNAQGNRGQLTILTQHTNRQVCRWEGQIASADETSLVAIEERVVPFDTTNGQHRILSGCRVRAIYLHDGIRLEQDWPPGCTRYACESRGTSMGRAATTKSTERCSDLAQRVGKSRLPKLVGPKPAWALSAKGGKARLLADYGGVWTDPHTMEIASEGDEDSQDVVDQLEICARKGRVLYTFINWTINGHSCALEGHAAENAGGDLLLIGDKASALFLSELREFIPGPRCHLRAQRRQGRLEVVSAWPSNCYSEHCGARAAPEGTSFSEKRRQAGPCVAAPEAE